MDCPGPAFLVDWSWLVQEEIMETIGAYEVKTHLARLLRRVAAGESFEITRNGVPVAKLVPIDEKPKRDVSQVIEEILEFRKTHRLDGLSIKDLINEGRRI
jgi:prevent-host-death family protein